MRVFDNLGVGESPVVAKCSFALAPYCEWITEAEYVPNNRPRQPTVLINDELSEESDDDAEEVIASDCLRLLLIGSECRRLLLIASDCLWLPLVASDCL